MHFRNRYVKDVRKRSISTVTLNRNNNRKMLDDVDVVFVVVAVIRSNVNCCTSCAAEIRRTNKNQWLLRVAIVVCIAYDLIALYQSQFRTLVMTTKMGTSNIHFPKVSPNHVHRSQNAVPTLTDKRQSSWDDICFLDSIKPILDLARSFCIIFLLVSCLFARIIILFTLTRSAINQYDFRALCRKSMCDLQSAYEVSSDCWIL